MPFIQSPFRYTACMETAQTHAKPIRLLYFWTGITATLLYRAIIVLEHYTSAGVKAAWYLGTVGFIIYFSHRFRISQKRSRLILEHNLIAKVDSLDLDDDDKAAMRYIFTTLESTKEKWNYIWIFLTSALALLAGIILDLVG